MIDLVASAPHYRAHAGPVWAALPADLRGPGDVALVASWLDHRLARRTHQRFIVMEHGIGQSYGTDQPGYPGGARREADLFLAPNEHAASRWRAAYPSARVEVIGDPVLDDLPGVDDPDDEDDYPVIAISSHWACDLAPETRPALAHYAKVLPELARRFRVIGHAHPKSNLASFWRRLGIEYVSSFEDVCRRADVYMCDNSSTLYEFATTGRPVVVLNAPWYRRGVRFGLRFWDAADVGVQVDQPADLIASVERALACDPEDVAKREAALDIVYAYRTGAAKRGAGVITDWLGASLRSVAA